MDETKQWSEIAPEIAVMDLSNVTWRTMTIAVDTRPETTFALKDG